MTVTTPAAAWSDRANELADWALARLFVRTDRFGGYHRKAGKTAKSARPNKGCGEPFSRDVLVRHFRAAQTADVIGSYALTAGEGGTGRWVAIDIDAHGPDDDRAGNERYALHLSRKLKALGFRPLLVTWGTGGYHLWVLLDRDVPGAVLFAFARCLVNDAQDFGYPKPPETFPKQPALAESGSGSYGNWLRVPGRHHTEETFAAVFDGVGWVDGGPAVDHILTLTGDSPDLLPAEAKPAANEKTTPRNGKARGSTFTYRAPGPDVFAEYNAAVTLDTVVGWHEARGHRVTGRDQDRVEFLRSGKDGAGQSFNVKLIGGVPVTYNFSTNSGLPENTGLGPAQVRCLYETGACGTAAMSRFAAVLRKELGQKPAADADDTAEQPDAPPKESPAAPDPDANETETAGKPKSRGKQKRQKAKKRGEQKRDCGRDLFRDKEELRRLAAMKLDAPDEFALVRADLRERGGSVRDLDKALEPLVRQLLQDRRAAAPPGTPAPGETGYIDRDGCLYRVRYSPEGDVEQIPLTNFTARLAYHTVRDDGVEQQRFFSIEGHTAGGPPLPTVEVPTTDFPFMHWPVEHWGNAAIVHAGATTRDHARAAIQFLSGQVPRRDVYTHLGWRAVKDRPVFLHAGGAIGPDGDEPDVLVSVGGSLAGFVLPEPPLGAALVPAVRTSLGLLRRDDPLAPDRLTFAGLAAVYRAPLGDPDFGIHFHGPTGRFKSEFAALLQQHYGAGLDARNFPANWMSTANALEEQAFLSKDVLIACDDFNPTGAVDPQKLHAVADRLFRGAGNHAGRGRMNADRSLAAPRPARGLILSTGEDLMKGHSCRARVIMIEVRPGDVSKSRLTACQADARAGLYATSMSAYVQWLAPRITEIRKGLPAERAALREQFLAGAPHARTPAAAADLMIGLSYLTRFAVEVNAITGVEARRLLDRGKAAVLELVAEQTDSLQAADPVNQFLELLPAVLTSGQAHLSDPKGWAPAPEQAHGWQHDGTNWKPRGVRIGWAEGDDIYLSPDAAFAEVQKLASTQREPITMSATTLWKRLHQRNLLAQVDDRGGRTRFAVRKTLGGEQVQVLCFKRCVFFPPKATGWGEDGGQGGQNEGNAQENERFTTATQPNGCGHVATGGGHLWEGNPEGTGHRGGQPGSGVQGGGQCEKPTLLNGSATNGHHGHTADPRNGRPSANGTARRNPPDAR